jgi:hypothetical protein
MNFQEKLFETTAHLRTRAADLAAKRVHALKGSFEALTVAGREFNQVARRHATRFVKANSTLAAEAGKDVSMLARATFATLAKSSAAPQKARKSRAPSTRSARKAA